MNLTIYYNTLLPTGVPVNREFHGVKDITFIKGTLSFKMFDPHISDFRLVKLKIGEFLYFTCNLM